MIIVKVELHHARTGQVTEIARMQIHNTGASRDPAIGEYVAQSFRGRSTAQLDKRVVQRRAEVKGHRRLSYHVLVLVRKALEALKY